MKCTGIVLAAGQGKRMNSKIQKQFLCLQGYPVLYYSLKAFQECPWMQEVVLVTGLEEIEYCRKEIVEHYGFTKVKAVVAGGKERYHSVQNGLKACETADYVFIHDGARPFLNGEILERGLECVKEWKACVAVPHRIGKECGMYRLRRSFLMILLQTRMKKLYRETVRILQTMLWLWKNMGTIQ